MGYCETTLYVHVRLKQENALRRAPAYTRNKHRDPGKDCHVPCPVSLSRTLLLYEGVPITAQLTVLIFPLNR